MNNLDASNREPLFYEVYPGSINDVSQLTCMIDKVHGYGYRNLGFILDRGYFSRKNLSYMEQNGYSFLIMIKGRNSSVLSYWKTMGDLKTAGQSQKSCFGVTSHILGTKVCVSVLKKHFLPRYLFSLLP